MKQFFTCLLCLALLGMFYSCQKGPNNGVPIYMKMDWGHVNTSASDILQGDTSHNITDVWVQTTSNNLGAYQLPCDFPVLEENQVHFLVSAGVWESGQQEVRVPYPFYAADSFTINNATPGQTYSHHPSFSYLVSAQVQCKVNFEGGGRYYDSMSVASRATDTNVKYGNYCGVIKLTNTDSDVLATVHNPSLGNANVFSVTFGSEVWLELDYKADVPFWIGVFGVFSAGQVTSNQVLFTLASPTWNKLYVKLTNVISGDGAQYYYPYFEALDTVGGSGGNVYLDNIKVVHF